MEELFLCRFLTYNKLYIINKKHINVTVTVSESSIAFFSIFFITDGIYKLIGESFTCYIQYLFIRIVFDNKMCNSLHKMSLAKSNTTIYKKWVIYFARRFGNSYRGCMCKAVIVTNDKCVECIIRIKIKGKIVRIVIIFLRLIFFNLFFFNLFLMFKVFIGYKTDRVFIIHNLTDSYFKKFTIFLFYEGYTHTALRY